MSWETREGWDGNMYDFWVPENHPTGWYNAPSVDLDPAALTVARLVAERDEARRERDEARSCSLYTSINALALSRDMYKREVENLHKEIEFLRGGSYASPAQSPKVKWAVRDNVDGCWLGDNQGMPVFTLGKEERGFFDSKEEALAQYKAYMKYWYAQEEWSKPVFVKVRCK